MFEVLTESNCVTLSQLHQIKGRGFAPITIKRWIKENLLIEGKHYLRMPGVTGKIKVNVKALNKFLDGIN